MLRIMIKPTGGPQSPPSLPEDHDTDLEHQDPSEGSSPKFEADKATPRAAGYMGPEMGPFECEHCVHWEDPNACTIVSGPIDPHGCCNNFEPGNQPSDDETNDQDQDQGSES